MTIVIDGSHGEGGGQILRTTLSLAAVLKREVEIHNIRKGRKVPGLQPQHLTCVNACKEITDAEVEGNNLQSILLRFSPKNIKGGDFLFDVARIKGSAGSVSLVLQSILLPLLLAEKSTEVEIKGGTHVSWSPAFTYLQQVFLPTIKKIGCKVEGEIKKWGWYPKGGGKVSFSINTVEKLLPLNLLERGKLLKLSGVSAVSNLPIHIAKRQRDQAYKVLREKKFSPEIELVEAPSIGKGTFFFILAEFEHSLAGFSSLGAIGKRAETVADEACQEFLEFMQIDAALEKYLADQLIPYLSLTGEKSSFTVSSVSQHLLTNIWVVKNFLPVRIEVEGKEGEKGKIFIDSSEIKNKIRIKKIP
ncbi:MAG: RNA 3'-terminal phosphate cyclase [Candidatus Zixiibacteriota bacterium]